MKRVSKSRKQIVYRVFRVAISGFSKVMAYYRTAQYNRLMGKVYSREAERGGLPFPAGGVIHEEGPEKIIKGTDPYNTITGTLTWRPKFPPLNISPEIDGKAFIFSDIDETGAWEKVKQRLSIPAIKEIEENHLRRGEADTEMHTARVWERIYEKLYQTREEDKQQHAERVEQEKKDLSPINDYLKSVNHPELPTIINFNGDPATKWSDFKNHLKDCISTDCCGRCQKDKPE